VLGLEKRGGLGRLVSRRALPIEHGQNNRVRVPPDVGIKALIVSQKVRLVSKLYDEPEGAVKYRGGAAKPQPAEWVSVEQRLEVSE
jgi:hypothetical protein